MRNAPQNAPRRWSLAVLLALAGAAASGCGARPIQPGGGTGGGVLGGMGGGIVGTGTGGQSMTGTGGASGVAVPCMGATDSRLVVADQRILRLTSNEVVNTVRYLINDAEAQAVNSDMFAITRPAERHFPPSDGEQETFNDTNILPIVALSDHVANYVLDNFSTLASCPNPTDACATIYLNKLAARAYRRPLKPDEQARFTALYTNLRSTQIVNGYQVTFTVEEATSYAVQAVLSSPQTLWRWELGDPSMASTSPAGIPLTDNELATALAFFMTDQPPDDGLLADAAAGRLRGNLSAQVQRLLQSPIAKDWLRTTMEYYYLINQLPYYSVDPTKFPITDALVADMETEARMFLDNTLWNGNLTDLLLSRTTFLNTNLATNIYGVPIPPDATDTNFTLATLPADQRSGLLTNAGFLTARDRSNGQDIVSRGKAVMAAMLCLTTSPPTDVSTTMAVMIASTSLDQQTGQEQVATRAGAPVCRDCHGMFDPYGLALENYDAIGRYRVVYDYLGGKPIDATATLPAILGGGTVANGVELAQKLAASPAFTNCLAKSFLQYALVDLSSYVELPLPPQQAGCAAADVVQRYQSAGGKTFSDLVRSVTAAPAFVLRRAAQ